MRDLPRLAFGVCDLFTALLVIVGVFLGLPARWFAVDGPAALVAVLLGAAGVGLLADRKWAKDVARVASFAVLLVAAAAIIALGSGIAYMRSIHGPLGKGGSVVFILVLALIIPYLVVLPATQLLWLGARRARPS